MILSDENEVKIDVARVIEALFEWLRPGALLFDKYNIPKLKELVSIPDPSIDFIHEVSGLLRSHFPLGEVKVYTLDDYYFGGNAWEIMTYFTDRLSPTWGTCFSVLISDIYPVATLCYHSYFDWELNDANIMKDEYENMHISLKALSLDIAPVLGRYGYAYFPVDSIVFHQQISTGFFRKFGFGKKYKALDYIFYLGLPYQ